MVFGSNTIVRKISVERIGIENVERFTFLGSSVTCDLNRKNEISVKTAETLACLTISLWTKVQTISVEDMSM